MLHIDPNTLKPLDADNPVAFDESGGMPENIDEIQL